MIKKIYKVLEEPENIKYGFFIQKLILINLLLNLFSFSVPYFFDLDKNIISILNIINNITVIFFIIELITRYIVIGINSNYKGFIGKIKFTFNFYTIIDIVSIIPFILSLYQINTSYLKLLRFVRILKFLRMKHTLKRFLNIHYFASSNIFIQSFILFVISLIIIYFFSYGYHSIKDSTALFLDPPKISDFQNPFEIFIGIIELLLGLLIGGALISIITSYFLDIIETVKKGHAPYKNDNHIIIINTNEKLTFMLDEINQYYKDEDIHQEIVILVQPEELENFKNNLKSYYYLEFFILTGDVLNWLSYDRLNINEAKKVIILKNNNTNNPNENEKISQFILSNNNFNNSKTEFIIETEHSKYAYDIYGYVFKNKQNNYTLINHEEVIEQFLNRSVIDYNYFKVYFKLLSFSEGFEFYVLNFDDIFEEDKLFYLDAYLKLDKAILTGVIKNNEIFLNPLENMEIDKTYKLVLLMKDRFSFEIKNLTNNLNIEFKEIEKPKLKEYKKLCIIGEYNDISLENIIHFLDDDSKNKIQHIVKDNYMDKNLWNELLNSDLDIIIFNLEDEEEFILTMFLKSIYTKQELSKLVNIFFNPQIANLLSGNDRSNLILSDEIVGKFITQNLFNKYAFELFDEITQTKGNEFYILDKIKYNYLYQMDFNSLKIVLFKNNMVYIGGFIDDEFYFNENKISQLNKIVVLARGII